MMQCIPTHDNKKKKKEKSKREKSKDNKPATHEWRNTNG
jgi:hypothetical protein